MGSFLSLCWSHSFKRSTLTRTILSSCRFPSTSYTLGVGTGEGEGVAAAGEGDSVADGGASVCGSVSCADTTKFVANKSRQKTARAHKLFDRFFMVFSNGSISPYVAKQRKHYLSSEH